MAPSANRSRLVRRGGYCMPEPRARRRKALPNKSPTQTPETGRNNLLLDDVYRSLSCLLFEGRRRTCHVEEDVGLGAVLRDRLPVFGGGGRLSREIQGWYRSDPGLERCGAGGTTTADRRGGESELRPWSTAPRRSE